MGIMVMGNEWERWWIWCEGEWACMDENLEREKMVRSI